MSYLMDLQERLRVVARHVLPADPERCVHLTNMNKYTRRYLHRIVFQAAMDPLRLKITDQQLARLCRVSRKCFLHWFRHDHRLPKIFRRVRHFLREMILTNIYEDLGQLHNLRSDDNIQEPIAEPSKKTMREWRERMKLIREEYQNRGPAITDFADAVETIAWMLDAQNSSDSSESDGESRLGEDPDDSRSIDELECDGKESALNGPPEVLNDDEISKKFRNILVFPDKLEDYVGIQDASPSDTYQS